MPLRLQVFQHVPHEGLGSMEPLFADLGARSTYTRFFAGDAPQALGAFDLLVVMGGPMGVYDEAEYPWLKDEKRALREALGAGKPVLGNCLGSQLIAEVLGGAVTRNAHREIGWWPVEKLPGLGDHWAASCFPDRFTTFHWHGDTFSIPPGAVPLFRSEGCAHQGFAWGDRVLALQFHPEITPEAVASWIAEGGDDLRPGPYVQDAKDLLGAPDDFAANNLWMKRVCEKLVGAKP